MILLRYLMLETFKSQIGILFVLFLIFVSQQFIRILAEAIKGAIPADLVMTFLYLNIPALATLMLPISFFLAVLFAYGRLYSESEMVAMISCGYSPNNVLKSTLLLSFFTFVFSGANSLYLTPLAENQIDTVTENAEANTGSAPVIEGIFHKISDDGVVYVEKYKKGKELEKIFAAHWPEDPDMAPSILTALHGKLEVRDTGTWLTMTNGQRYVGNIGENEFDKNVFKSFQIHIENREVQTKKRGVEALPTKQLIGSDNLKYQAELQWRIALPLSIILLTFMAVPLARVNPRQGRYSKLLPALSLYLTYFLLLSTSKSLIEEGDLPVFSIWIVQLLFFVVGVLLHLQSLGKFTNVFFKRKRAKTA